MPKSLASATAWKLQHWLFAAGLAVALGAAYATAIGGRPSVGAGNGLVIGGTIAALEIFVLEAGAGAALRRRGLWPLIGATTMVWAALIVATLELARVLLGHPWGAPPGGHPHNTLIQDIAFAFAVGFVVSFVARLQSLIGTRTLVNFLLGKYARPVREDRVILILDLADSTALAERLGALKLQELIGRFFFEISEPIVRHGGEIHQYIGDAVVVTWPSAKPRARMQAVRCVFALNDLIDQARESYRAEFGVVPDFRAGLHCGPIVVSEVGGYQRAIAFFGDTMNTTARLQQSCKELGQQVLASEEIIATLDLGQGISVADMGELSLAGKSKRVRAFSLERAPRLACPGGAVLSA